MSKRTYFKRYIWLFEQVQNNPYITFEEIEDRFFNSELIKEDDAKFSKRTFHRDQKEIFELFGVEIKYNKQRGGYYIDGEYLNPNTELLLDSYRFINTYQIFKDIDKYLASEPRKTGNKHLLFMLDAISNRKRISFTYSKFTDPVAETKTVEPYFVKEFKNRWYLIAKDVKDKKVKTYALERVINDPSPESVSASFDIPREINPPTWFNYSFGIFRVSDNNPETVQLSAKPLKAKFFVSQPLHNTQTVISEGNEETVFEVKLHITHDFVMELLSHGSEIKILKPHSLKETIVNELQQSINQYK